MLATTTADNTTQLAFSLGIPYYGLRKGQNNLEFPENLGIASNYDLLNVIIHTTLELGMVAGSFTF